MDEVDLRGADHFRRARVWEARALIGSADLAGPPNCSARIKSFLRYVGAPRYYAAGLHKIRLSNTVTYRSIIRAFLEYA